MSIGILAYSGPDGDGTFIRELGRIGKKVYHHLAEAHGICSDDGDVRIDVLDDLDRFILDQAGYRWYNTLEQLGDIHIVKGQLHLAGIDLGQVENIIDEAEEMLARI